MGYPNLILESGDFVGDWNASFLCERRAFLVRLFESVSASIQTVQQKQQVLHFFVTLFLNLAAARFFQSSPVDYFRWSTKASTRKPC